MPLSQNEDHASARPLRQGESWTRNDYEQLLHGVLIGLTVEQIAAELQRTPGGVRGQLRNLVPVDAAVKTTRACMDWLRQRLKADPPYDWRAVLNSRSDGPFRLWSDDEEDKLGDGWVRRVPLPKLAKELSVSEPSIVHRIVALGLAQNVAEVVERLGATPGGTVDVRARLLRAELSEAIYVLIIDGSRRPRTSLHHSQEEAERVLREVIGDPAKSDRRWWVLRRTLDGRDAGQSWTASPDPEPL